MSDGEVGQEQGYCSRPLIFEATTQLFDGSRWILRPGLVVSAETFR